MNECSEISDLPASTPTMKSTSHFGENDGDDPGFSKDDACRRAAMESGIPPHVAGGSRRARPAAPTAPAQSGGRTPPRVVQISSNLSDRMFLGTSGRPMAVLLPMAKHTPAPHVLDWSERPCQLKQLQREIRP